MPAKPGCQVHPFLNWFSRVSTTIFKARDSYRPVTSAAFTTLSITRTTPKSNFAAASYKIGCNPHFFSSRNVSVAHGLWRSQQQQVSASFREVIRSRSLFENLQPWSKRLSHERIVVPKLSRPLSTKPTKPRVQKQDPGNLSAGTGAGTSFLDLDDGSNPSLTLQKSLAAVPHHAVKDEIRLRRSEIDVNGKIVKSAVGEFLKSDLCSQYGIHPRDLRKIDGGFSNHMPVILVRPEVIIVNMGHIRALIKADLIVLFDSPDSDDRVEDSLFVKDLQDKLKQNIVQAGGQTFEFRALEAIFISIVASLHGDMEILVRMVTKLLKNIEEEVDQYQLKEMLQYTKKVSRFESKTLLIREVFEELLDQDEDLAAMYLTEKKEGHPRPIDQHDEIEILLESYMKQVEEIANVIYMVKQQMQSTEDFVSVILAAKRNQLLLFELKIALGTVGISSGALIAGLYGMNLQNYLEQDPHAFAFVSALAVSLGAVVFGTGVRKLRTLAIGSV
ncbi:magnesium ion transporter [Mortierella sp. AM989]|nr:magnesium ion transporter [Mortierella sp. AM989]